MINMGFLAALGAALAWGSYNVPFKKSNSSNIIQFQALMCVGAFIFALVISLIFGYSLNFNVYALAAGVLWALANTLSLSAISNIGLSRAAPIWMSLVITASFLWGVLIFKELPQGLLIGLGGIILIILGAVLVTSSGNTKSVNAKLGIIQAILAGSLFGTYIVPVRFSNLQAGDALFPMSLGVLLFGTAYFIFKGGKFKKEAIFPSILAGVIWNIGNLLSIIAISLIGLAKAFPLGQVAVLVAVSWGLFYFKEVTKPKDRTQVLVGAIILLVGVITLGLA